MSENFEQYREAAEEALERKKEAEEKELNRQRLELEMRGEAVAAASKEKVRREALRAWQTNGGSIAEFAAQWEKLYAAILFERTVGDVTKPKSGGRRVTTL